MGGAGQGQQFMSRKKELWYGHRLLSRAEYESMEAERSNWPGFDWSSRTEVAGERHVCPLCVGALRTAIKCEANWAFARPQAVVTELVGQGLQ